MATQENNHTNECVFTNYYAIFVPVKSST